MYFTPSACPLLLQAIPRITSKGCVSGAVYKVCSQPDMQHLAA